MPQTTRTQARSRLKAASIELRAATALQIDALKELYPLNVRIQFHLMYGQKNPSTGRVAGYVASWGGGSLRVEHAEAKAGSRYRFRTVAVDQILDSDSQ